MTSFKTVAESLGYTVFYDRSIRLWTFIKDGAETEYFTTEILDNIGLLKLKEFLERNG